MQSKEQMSGLRPFEEISQIVTTACVVKQENPKDHYKILDQIGTGGYSVVYKC